MKNCSNKDCTNTNPQPLTEFYKHKNTKDNLSCRCKTCIKSQVSSWRKNNREKVNKINNAWYSRHKDFCRDLSYAWRKKNPEKYKKIADKYANANFKKIKGKGYMQYWNVHTPEDAYSNYVKLLESQNFVCAICFGDEKQIDHRSGKKRELSVDHCHKTGKVRGLLCFDCNTLLGKLENNMIALDRIQKYLKGELS